MYRLTVVLMFFVGVSSKNQCPLSWHEMSSGGGLHEHSVPAHKNNLFVARGLIPRESGTIAAGFYDAQKDEAYVAQVEGQAHTLFNFEVLINPHGCLTNWVSITHSDIEMGFVVPYSDDSGLVIGRAESSETSMLHSGSVDMNRNEIIIPNGNNTETKTGLDYLVLVSYSNGLNLIIKEINFDDDVFGGPADILGIDVIHNDADTEVTQTVSHSKSVSQSYSLTTSSSFTVAETLTLGIEAGIEGLASVAFSYSKTWSETHTSSTTMTTSETRTVESIRSIKVPAFTSVEACSMVESVDDFTTNWNAKAHFSLPGKSAVEVENIVKAKDASWANKEFTHFGNTAIAPMGGSFQGSLAISSKFFVASSGCFEAQKYLASKRKERRNNSNYDWQKERKDLENIFLKSSFCDRGMCNSTLY